MEPKKYATAAAFRRALEDRLQDIAGKESVDLQRLRRQVAFDRLLARLFQGKQPLALPWVLKGGYAMELRIKAARTTKDIDLAMRGTVRGRAQPFEHGLQLNESVVRSNVQHCERADHFQSTLPSYSHSVSFVHQQEDGLEFGRKRYRFALACIEICQGGFDGLLQAHYFQPFGRLGNPRAHDSGSVYMSQLGCHGGRDDNPSL